jgi:hypothetical protein
MYFTRSTIVFKITRIIGSFLSLEDITRQLLKSKHTYTLGQLSKITLDLKQYVVAKLAFDKQKPLEHDLIWLSP